MSKRDSRMVNNASIVTIGDLSRVYYCDDYCSVFYNHRFNIGIPTRLAELKYNVFQLCIKYFYDGVWINLQRSRQ